MLNKNNIDKYLGFSLADKDFNMLNAVIKEYLIGFKMFEKVKDRRIMTIYGGSRIKSDDQNYLDISKISIGLREMGWVVTTGGGPGIMTAGLEGHVSSPSEIDTIAYNIDIRGEEDKAEADLNLRFGNFPVRKYWLRQADVFIIAPGGYGTMDEVMELLTLIQTNKIPKKHIIFYNAEYWKGLIDFFENTLLKNNAISEESLKLYSLCSTPEDTIYKANIACEDQYSEEK